MRVRRFAISLLLCCLAASPAITQGTEALVVDDDLACPNARFSTIQSAVDAAAPGAVIRVCAGAYTEHVRVTKTLVLSARPALEARLAGSITITAHDVVVEGFTIDAAGYVRGITVEYEIHGGAIRNNTISNAIQAGIQIFEADDGQVVDNRLSGNGGPGLHLLEAFDYEVRRNTLSGNGTDGILVNEGANNVVRSNTVRNNLRNGIQVCTDTRLNRVEANTITGSGEAGILVCSDSVSSTALTKNVMAANAIDAVDQTSGDGTGGTGSYWRNNICRTSSPDGLCRRSR